ncbi:unnamed protein product [Closterium sp. NIES-53]
MDVWGPAPIGGTDQECYFLLVVDDYARYTTVFPLRRKADVSGVLIPWIRATRRQLRERFCGDLLVLRLHPDRGETSPTLRWTGKVGDASVFRFYHPRSRRVFSSQDVTFDESVWLLRPPGFTGSFPAGTQWSLRRPVYGLCQAPREWHDTPRTTLAALGFAPSTADPSLFLRTDTTLPPFYVLVYVNDLDFATADTEALALVKAELQERHTCTYLGELPFSASASSSPRHSPLLCLLANRSQLHLRTSPTSGMGLVLGGQGSVALTGYSDASWADDQATQRSSQGYTFSLGYGSVSWRSTRSSSVLSSSCEAEIYAGAMAAQELRWLTYLLTDLGERPRSPPVLYVDNKAMLALCHEQRLENRTKQIALCYFLARELQQRRQLRLSYVASRANTADVFTETLGSGDHQRFCTALGLVPTLPHLLVA